MYVQIMACGSFDLEVPRRNLRSLSFVSWEKEYNLVSDCKDGCTRQHIHVDDISELAEETQLAIFVCLSTIGTNEQDSSLSGSC